MKSMFFVKTRDNLGQYREIYVVADSISHVESYVADEIVELKKVSIDKLIVDGTTIIDNSENKYTVNSTYNMLID